MKTDAPLRAEWIVDGMADVRFIQFIVSYYKNEHVRAIPLIITEGENTWQILPNSVQKLNDCNHHEADTRIVL